jgi:hypothetical protein
MRMIIKRPSLKQCKKRGIPLYPCRFCGTHSRTFKNEKGDPIRLRQGFCVGCFKLYQRGTLSRMGDSAILTELIP